MKKLVFLLLAITLFPFSGFTQIIDSLDFVSPFHEGFAAISKNNQWAIINEKGSLVIPFRDDFVKCKTNDNYYPQFYDGRCLIMKVEDKVTYFGYIDKNGNTIIEPLYLNATNFKYNKAIVLKLVKQSLGYNNLMDKPVFTYKYQEIVIDNSGKVINYLTKLAPLSSLIPFDKIPEIKSKIISKDLVVIKNGHDFEILKKM